MFSSRMFAALALVAAAAAYPADNQFIPRPITTLTEADFEDAGSWWSFPSLDTFFKPLLNFFPSFSEIGPKIEVDDEKFRVIVNVKDYKMSDLKVKVKGDFIFIQGWHEAKDSDHDIFASNFIHTYSMPQNARASEVTAVLYSDGFLEVTAPLKGTGEKDKPDIDIEVPITENAEPYKKVGAETTENPERLETPAVTEVDSNDKTEGTTLLPSTISEVDDRREPTTSSDREEATEKDNTIPHGTEASEADELNEVQP